jgi:hypothetical protein
MFLDAVRQNNQFSWPIWTPLQHQSFPISSVARLEGLGGTTYAIWPVPSLVEATTIYFMFMSKNKLTSCN